jgi:hypothetical protein
MKKRDELTDPRSCFSKAADDEPLFVLRAQDFTAPATILDWLLHNPDLPDDKHDEAIACIEAMEAWHTRKMPD